MMGSKDETWTALRRLALADPHVVAMSLTRNFGHQLALSAGLSVCQGERILIIDADLQDPPKVLPEMYRLMDGGADVVYGVSRTDRLARRDSSDGPLAVLPDSVRALRCRDPNGCRRFSADDPAGARCAERNARATPVHTRHGRLGRVSSGSNSLRPGSAILGDHSLSIPEDAPLRAGRHHEFFNQASPAQFLCLYRSAGGGDPPAGLCLCTHGCFSIRFEDGQVCSPCFCSSAVPSC